MGSFRFDVRDLISPPFIRCGACGRDESGVTGVGPHHLRRRCRRCGHSESRALPALCKKIVYIDQWAISDMAKALTAGEGEQEEANARLLELFTCLSRLVSLQLIVCPDSAAHRDESAVARDTDSLRRLYEQLSNGVTFESFGMIRDRQILDVLDAWLESREPPPVRPARSILRDDPDVWSDRLRVSVDMGLDFSGDLRETRRRNEEALVEIHAGWRANPRTFAEHYAEQLQAWGDGDLAAWADYHKKLAALEAGENADGYAHAALSAQVRRVRVMLREIDERAHLQGDPEATLAEFYRSGQLQNVPSVRIASMIYAALGSEARDRRPPNRGTVGDINVVSCLLPHCDAMLLDRSMAGLLRNEPLRREVEGHGCRVFASNTLDNFVSYLRGVEAGAEPAHLLLVEEVYGSGCPPGTDD